MDNPTETVRAERLFKRAQELVHECDEKQLREGETFPETIQRLCFRVAELEGAADKDEYDG